MKFLFLIPCLLACATAPFADAATPWDVPFATDTAAIQKAASAGQFPSSEAVAVLLDDHRYSIDKAGHVHYELRQVYRILSKDYGDSWSTVEAGYQPWRGEKPTIRARVIAEDGSVHLLDPKTIADSPSTEFDANIFSDQRIVRAPLPAIGANSIVEYEIEGEEWAGSAEMGVMKRVSAYNNVPLQRFHVTIESAKGAPSVQLASGLIPETAIRRGKAPGTIAEIDLGPLEAIKDFEGNLPPDIARYPWVTFSTGATWSAMASSYSDIVDRQIQGADLHALMGDVDLTGPAPVVAARLASRLHREIRYTGVELGEAAIVPTAPAEVLRRRYGDCKDKSALLVAMLRAAGLKAYVALLRAGPGLDVGGQVAGTDLFDHAIVYVATEPALWIDATASDTRVGTLPPGDQGRLALIAMRGTAGLTRTADDPGAWQRKTFDIRFADYGSGAIVEKTEAAGEAESEMRARYAEESKAKDVFEKYVKSAYRAKSLGAYSVTGRGDLGAPFIVTAEAVGTAQVFTGDDGAKVELSPAAVLDTLPYELRADDDEDGGKRAPRKSDFYFPEAVNAEQIYLLHPPTLFRAGTLPASREIAMGPLTWSRSYSVTAGGGVEVRYKVVSSKRRLTAAEFETAYKALHEPGLRQNDAILFAPVTAEYTATGQTAKAIALLEQDVAQHSADAGAHIRLSHVLLDAGMGFAARAEARKATEADPHSSPAWQALGWTLQHDDLGRRFAGNWDLAESEKCYREALKIDPDDLLASIDLAILLEHNANGVRYGSGARLAESIAIYRAALAKQPNPVIESNLNAALVDSGLIDEAHDEAKKRGANAQIDALYTAIHETAARAVVDLQSEFPDPATRAQQMAGTALTLIRLRRYDDARMMLTAAARSANAQQLAPLVQMIANMKKREEIVLPETDPRSLPQRFMAEMLSGHPDRERVRKLWTSGAKMDDFDKGVAELRTSMAPVERQLGSIGLSEENLVDLTLSMISVKLDGDETHGYRATMQGGPSPLIFYLAPEDGGWRILGVSDSPEEVGAHVLDLLAKNRIADAQWWLDKTVPDLSAGSDQTGLPIERELWSGVAPETRGAPYIRRTAASMMARFSNSPEGIAILKSEIAKTKDATELGQLNTALCDAWLRNEDWAQLDAAAHVLEKYKPYAAQAFRYLARADRKRKNWKALEEAANARQAATTDVKLKLRVGAAPETIPDEDVLSALIAARINQGNFAGAEEAAKTIRAAQPDRADEAEAWIQLLSGKADEALLTEISRESMEKDAPYTKAAIQIALGHTDDARDSLALIVKDGALEKLDSRAWVIHGLIAAKYGLDGEAAASWKRAREAKNTDDAAEWSLSLIPKSK